MNTLLSRVLLSGLLAVGSALPVSAAVGAERLKDLASISGVRQNQLMGYGLVVGLDGSGDQTTQTPFTVQSIVSMLQQLGVNTPAGSSLQLKNVAAVMVTASLPAFSQPGQTMDVTVSSIGNAKSLRGGTLLMTPLKGGDGNIYGMAQGQVVVSPAGGAAGGGGGAQVNHLSVGRISAGATVERAVPNQIAQGDTIALELREADYATASKVVEAINDRFGIDTAAAQDARVIRVRVPESSDERVSFLGALEHLTVKTSPPAAKVIMNARTGSIVMNQSVALDPCAVAHGSLSVVINNEPGNTTITALPGATIVTQTGAADAKGASGNKVMLLSSGVTLAEVVKALNAIGATPQDLLAILQAMKAAGSLRAELEII